MKKALKIGILSLALAFAGGSFAFIKAGNNKPIGAKAASSYVAKEGSNNLTYDQFISELETSSSTKTYTLLSNITLTDSIDINKSKTTTIDLSGYTISGSVSTLFNLSNYTQLTINSSGSKGNISGSGQKVFSLTGATLELNNVNVSLADTTSGNYVIYASSGSNIIRTNTVQVLKGYTGVLLSGTSSFYSTGTLVTNNQNASGYGISCNTTSSVYFSGILSVTSIYANNTINFFDGSMSNPQFVAGFVHNPTITVGDSLKTLNAVVAKGVMDNSLINNITVNGLTNSGYKTNTVDFEINESTTARNIVLEYYYCLPYISGDKFTVYSPDPVTTIAYNSNSSQYYEFDFLADIGYYFGETNSNANKTISVTIGGEEASFSYGKYEVYNTNTLYKHGTVRIAKNLIKAPVVITVNPLLSNYLKSAKDFITNYLHMDDYDATLSGNGSGWCKDNEHKYYVYAKEAFLSLGNLYREAFMLSTDEDVVLGRERFIAWAAANHESIVIQDGNYNIVRNSNELITVSESNTSSIVIVISAISVISVTALVLYLKKRKESSK